jgi:AsmA-like C-terminal region
VIVVGAATGYLVSSGLGERLLHAEIDRQLTRLMAGNVEIGEVKVHFRGGLRLEARDLEAYTRADDSSLSAMRANRAVAWVDPLALLIGRLELSTLVLEAPFVRLEQDAAGRFRDLPLPPIEFGPIGADNEGWTEALIQRIEGLDATAEALFGSIRSADRVEILDGTIQWLRPGLSGDEAARSEVRLELFSTVIERDWISDEVGLELSAVFVDGLHAPFPFAVAIERGDNASAFDWTVSMSQIPLAAAKTPLSFIDSIDGLSGQLTTAIHLRSTADGKRRLKFDGQIHNASIGLRQSKSRILRERVTLDTELEIGQRSVRLLGAHLEGKYLALDFKGSIARPIRPRSQTRLESRMVGIELEEVFEIFDSLKAESDLALTTSLFGERIEGGQVRYIEAAGTASLVQWQDLAGGRTLDLPRNFALNVAFEDVSVYAGPDDRIEGLRGEVEWAEDQVTFRDTTASFRGSKLPNMHMVLSGIHHLALIPDSERRSSIVSPPIPGIAPLIELIKPKDPDALPPVKAIGLAIDRLEHPLFRFPFKDLRVLIEPQRRGISIQVRDGIWGGASVTGDVAFTGSGDSPLLSAHLTLGPGTAASDPDSTSGKAESTASTSSPLREAIDSPDPEAPVETMADVPELQWGKGRFEFAFRPRPKLPFRSATGFFRLEGTRLLANEVQFLVEPVGQIASRIVLDLADAEKVGVDLSFALTDGLLQHVDQFMGLRPGLTRGPIGATGSLRGSIQPDESLIAKLDGRVRVEARDGAIRTEIPLLFELSQASEGYNPFSNDDELDFETLTATIDFQQGSLLAEDFEIEGPLRLYARGRIEPLAEPSQVRGVVGIFLFRASSQLLESLPLVRYFLPGSKRGLIGAYFDVEGELGDPSIETLPVATLMTAVPEAIKAPFKVLRYLFEPSGEDS